MMLIDGVVEHLQQFLLAVTKKDKTIELKEKIHALSKLRDEKVFIINILKRNKHTHKRVC